MVTTVDILYIPVVCEGQQSYDFTIFDNINCYSSDPGGMLIIIGTKDVAFPGSISVRNSTNVAGIILAGNEIGFNCTDTPWSIDLTLDLAPANLKAGDQFQFQDSYNPTTVVPWVVLPTVTVIACDPLPLPNFPDPTVPLFKCSCKKTTKSTIVSTPSAIFTPKSGDLFKTIR